MEVEYHPDERPEAGITALPAEYAAMAERIGALAWAGVGEVVFPATGPGLSALAVRIGSGPVMVAAGDGVLSVSGGAEAVGLFARNMPAEPSLPSYYHVHFEHAGRESFVAADSVPLVMYVGEHQAAEPRGAPDRRRLA